VQIDRKDAKDAKKSAGYWRMQTPEQRLCPVENQHRNRQHKDQQQRMNLVGLNQSCCGSR
jgi:hypothetical protein